MKRSNAIAYNGIAIVFTGLTIFSFLCTLLVLARVVAPPSFLAASALGTPTFFLAPTDTITPTPSNTPTPSRTPIPPTATPVPPTETPIPTVTPIPPTATPVPPTPTLPPTAIPPTATAIPPTVPPTRAPTNTKVVPPTRTPRGFVASATPVGGAPPTNPPPTQTATAKPVSNQPFVVEDGSPGTGSNPDFTRGCNYQGVAGVVIDTNRRPLSGLRYKVNITTPGKKTLQVSYTPQNDTLYTSGSYVAQVAEKPTAGVYTVQVVNNAGKALSDKITITFAGNCEQNVIYLNFVQVKAADLP